MKFTARFLRKQANVKIRRMERKELEQVLDVAYYVFSSKIQQSEEAFKHEVREELSNRFSACYVAEVDGKIVGGYLMVRGKQFEVLDKLKTEMERKNIHIEGKTGVQGVALFVLPQYVGEGIGRQLRQIPIDRLKVDYVWGEHYKELDNLGQWIAAGRVLVAEVEDFFVTLKEIPRTPKVEKKKEAPIEKEPNTEEPMEV